MKIHFCRSSDIGGALIRFFTFSDWNHVAVEVNGTVYEATMSGGVSAHKPGERLWDKVDTIRIDDFDDNAAESFLMKQLGKPYDWKALLALPLRNDWQEESAWFCSELVAKALVVAGVFRLLTPADRITPGDVRLLVGTKYA